MGSISVFSGQIQPSSRTVLPTATLKSKKSAREKAKRVGKMQQPNYGIIFKDQKSMGEPGPPVTAEDSFFRDWSSYSLNGNEIPIGDVFSHLPRGLSHHLPIWLLLSPHPLSLNCSRIYPLLPSPVATTPVLDSCPNLLRLTPSCPIFSCFPLIHKSPPKQSVLPKVR